MCPVLAHLVDHSNSNLKKEVSWEVLRACGLLFLSCPCHWQAPLPPSDLLAWCLFTLYAPHSDWCTYTLSAFWFFKIWPFKTSLSSFHLDIVTPPERSLFQPYGQLARLPQPKGSCLMGPLTTARRLLGNERGVYTGSKGALAHATTQR